MLSAASPTAAQLATDRVMQSVDAEPTAEGWVLHLRFSLPFRYVRHSPRDHTLLGLVELEPVGITSADPTAPTRREALRPFEGGQGPPVVEVSTEANALGSRVVEIRFREPTLFEVAQGSDLQSLDVRLLGAGDSETARRARALLLQAADAMGAGDNGRAIALYTKVLSMDAPSTHPEAQERLGLARERNGQRAQARAEYEKYLELHPEGAAADRVRQRLSALRTAETGIPEERREVRRPEPSRYRRDLHGSLDTFYSRAKVYPDGFDDEVVDHALTADAYLTGRLLAPTWELEASGSGRTRVDLQDDDFANDSRLSSLLVEGSQRGRGWWGNVGRQRGGGGVLGRFDGARLGYRPTDQLDFHLLGGFPLETYSSDSLNTDRFQVGAVGQVLEVADLFDVSLYTNYQNEDDLTYRAAVGGEVRHLRPNRSMVLSVDYDPYFQALNFGTLLADVEVLEGWRVNTLVEYRKSPILTLGNALIGQPADSIEELHDQFSASEMKDLAEDRTAYATTFTFGSRYELNARFDLLGSWTATRLSGTDSSAGVIGSGSSGYEYTYYAQINGKALLMDRGITTVSVRVFDGDRLDSYRLQLNGRYPVQPGLRLNPILQLEYQDADQSSDLVRFVPRLRLDYTWGPLIFDLDVAGEVLESTSGARPDEIGYSLLVGVRYSF